MWSRVYPLVLLRQAKAIPGSQSGWTPWEENLEKIPCSHWAPFNRYRGSGLRSSWLPICMSSHNHPFPFTPHSQSVPLPPPPSLSYRAIVAVPVQIHWPVPEPQLPGDELDPPLAATWAAMEKLVDEVRPLLPTQPHSSAALCKSAH